MFTNNFIFIFLLCFGKCALGQTIPRLEGVIYKNVNQPIDVKTAKQKASIFTLYKVFISSQDGNSCTFYPSCSRFAAQSIAKKGLIVGALASFDRISRCNGHNHAFYLFHSPSQKQLDSVE